jgi:hypothetical protein
MQKVKVLVSMSLFFIFILFLPGAEQDKSLVQVKVEKGDCLIRICDKYLEKPSQWRTVAQVNNLKNPDVIMPGQVLMIPAELMKGTPVAGAVTFLQGTAEVKKGGTEGWTPLALNEKVEEGSFVRTGDESSIEIRFEDGNIFLLKPNTTIGLKTARKSSDKYSKYKMSISTGKLISNIQKATGRESAVQIEAPTAVLGVRGTVFRSSVLSDGTSQFEVLEGEVPVEGKKKSVDVKQGEGTIVHKDEIPIPPKKLLGPPALAFKPSPIYKKFPVQLSFEKVEGAVSYRVVLARDRGIKNIANEKVIGTQDTFKITDLEDGTYFMQSNSIDSLGLEGLPSEITEIYIRLNPIAPFVEIPADGVEYKSQALRCRWLRVSDAVRYHVQVSEDINFQRLAREEKNLVEPEYPTGKLDYKKYYFRVGCIAADNYQGEWSDILSFTLIPPPPSPPVEPPEMDKNSIKIRWKNLGKEVTYHVQMSGDDKFDEVMVDRRVETPETTFEKPKQAGAYYVRISGIDSANREGIFSKPQSFVILLPPPLVKTPVVDRSTVSMEWENLGKDVRYCVQISEDEEFEEVMIDSEVELPEITVKKPKQTGIYYARVSGIDTENRRGIFSKPQTFEIKHSYLPLLGIAGFAGLLFLLGI